MCVTIANMCALVGSVRRTLQAARKGVPFIFAAVKSRPFHGFLLAIYHYSSSVREIRAQRFRPYVARKKPERRCKLVLCFRLPYLLAYS